MGIINKPDETGQQIIDWKLEIFSNVNRIMYLKDVLNAQLQNMLTNEVFKNDDIKEIKILLVEIDNKINELNG